MSTFGSLPCKYSRTWLRVPYSAPVNNNATAAENKNNVSVVVVVVTIPTSKGRTNAVYNWIHQVTPSYTTSKTHRQYPQAVPTGSSHRQFPQAIPTGSTHRQYPQAVPTGRQFPQAIPTGSTHRQYPPLFTPPLFHLPLTISTSFPIWSKNERRPNNSSLVAVSSFTSPCPHNQMDLDTRRTARAPLLTAR